MAKNIQKQKPKTVEQPPAPKLNMKFWIMAAIVFLVSFIFYARSISNEYALDDGITMEKNEFVHKGVSGISDILTKDAYASFFTQLGSKGQLSGGRYRPLSIVTFAVEYELFGFQKGDKVSVTGTDGKVYQGRFKKISPKGEVTYTTKEYGDGLAILTAVHEFKRLAHIQHFNNVLLYSISMVVLFIFLYQVLFKKLNYREYWALFVTLVFAMHPIHSEVVANIKSRDEILSLLFILLTLLQFNRYLQKTNFLHGILVGILFFLAMLSKEYAVVLVFIIPVWTYVEQKKVDMLQIIMALVPLAVAFIPYYFLRINAVMEDPNAKRDVLNDYYLFAKGDEQDATQIYILLKYFLLQIYPYPLASDYSFKTIPFRHFSSPEVIFSLLFHLGLLIATIYSIVKKHLILSFALLFYILNLLLVSNIVFNIGASMGERLVYHSSMGLIIAVFYGIYVLTKKIKDPKIALSAGGVLTALVAIPFFMIVSKRCAAWKNDYTLATTDVKTNPNSALLNANAGTYILNRTDLFENKSKEKEMCLEARGYIVKALEVHPTMVNSWMSLAVIEHKLKNFQSSEFAVGQVAKIFPRHPQIPALKNMVSMDYINLGFEKYQQGKPDSCFYFLYKAKSIDPLSADVHYNLGGAYLSVAKNLDSAQVYFTRALQINPNHQLTLQGVASLKEARGQ